MTQGTATLSSHHPAVLAREPVTTMCAPGFEMDFLGIRTRRFFYSGLAAAEDPAPGERLVTTAYPPFDEEYFEWTDILESIEGCGDTYVFVELGAGWGRWCMRAYAALRSARPHSRFQCVAVEAEPNHFRWMVQHFGDNSVSSQEHDLVWAAVGPTPGFVPFTVGRSKDWYGQAIARPTAPEPGPVERRRLKARSVLGKPPTNNPDEQAVVWVPCVTLADLIAPYPRVDLIDMDLQRMELPVVEASMALLNERVHRVHIGTHGSRIEARLRAIFSASGWQPVHDYASQSQAMTPYGEIAFGDGVQSWVNPTVGVRRRRAHTANAHRVETVTPAAPELHAAPSNDSSGDRPAAADPDRESQEESARRRLQLLRARNRALKQRNRDLQARCRRLQAHQTAAGTPVIRQLRRAISRLRRFFGK